VLKAVHTRRGHAAAAQMLLYFKLVQAFE